jgi:DNA polymerase III subunit delta'
MWNTIGQKRALSLLQGSLSRGKVAHAYLFSGPPHVGKMTLAKDLAGALNCNAGDPPCKECSACQRISLGKHADVQEIGLSKNSDGKIQTEISIEEIRQIQHSANLPPFEGKCRFFIIDGAELLSTEAANCLLKTLEEPLDKVVFILLTSKEQLLPSTVVSRCQRIELIPLSKEEVKSALITKWKAPTEKADLLARISHGSLGLAVSAIDGNFLEQYTQQIDEILETIEADLEDKFDYATQMSAEFSQNREKVQDKLNLWLDLWHDLMLVKCNLLDMVTNIDRQGILKRMSEGLHLSQIKDTIESIILASEQLKLNANARLTLEVLMLGIPNINGRTDQGERNLVAEKSSQTLSSARGEL